MSPGVQTVDLQRKRATHSLGVLLVNPRTGKRRNIRFPLSILALAAVLEARFRCVVLDGNLEQGELLRKVRAALESGEFAAACVTVMPGPQIAPAIVLSQSIRAARPALPIIWGGYFPTLYPNAAINADYVDYVVRGQGEETLQELLEVVAANAGRSSAPALAAIRGVTWKNGDRIVHNGERPFRSPDTFPPLPYHLLGNVQDFIRPSFLGKRTASHQAAIGCRYRCRFCGVVSMFDGVTRLPGPDRLAADLELLRDRYGVDSIQYMDNNFFDTDDASRTLRDVLSKVRLPYWCFARTDALANLSSDTWSTVRRSGLRMVFMGAETASDAVLKEMRKGTRVDQTIEVAHRCRENGVIPEFSFILGGPHDPEGEIDRTFRFIRQLKAINPNCEIILYYYSPVPQRDHAAMCRNPAETHLPQLASYGPAGPSLPTTPEEWTQPRWVDYVCHHDAPWLTSRIRRKVDDFARVLACRFPTVQDVRTPGWVKSGLRLMSSWRYATGVYGFSWELELARRLASMREPAAESI